jgi:hypothetical protein
MFFIADILINQIYIRKINFIVNFDSITLLLVFLFIISIALGILANGVYFQIFVRRHYTKLHKHI